MYQRGDSGQKKTCTAMKRAGIPAYACNHNQRTPLSDEIWGHIRFRA